jgi:ABC-2 type transport system permease protein
MAKFWLVARREYLVAVRRRTFVIGTFGLPLAMAALIALSAVVALGNRNRRPVGYVDLAGLLAPAGSQVGAGYGASLRAFTDEAAAQSALLAGDIQAFYVIPADYLTSGRLLLRYGATPPAGDALAPFQSALRTALLANQPASVRSLVTRGPDLIMRTVDGHREISRENILTLLLPFVAGVAFTIATLTSANYMIRAVATEKENRMVEVVATSMTPHQLMGGKSLGLMGVAMTQLGLWAAIAAIGLLILRASVPNLIGLRIPGTFVAVILLFFLPSYALVAGMMTAIGSAVTEVHQGQQIAGTLNLFFLLPFFFLPVLLANPNSPLMVALTLFPTTAFLTVCMRWAFTTIPAWQLALSWTLLVISALVCVWAAARIFRVGMLRYGQSLDLQGMLAILRPASRPRVEALSQPGGGGGPQGGS